MTTLIHGMIVDLICDWAWTHPYPNRTGWFMGRLLTPNEIACAVREGSKFGRAYLDILLDLERRFPGKIMWMICVSIDWNLRERYCANPA